jgi:histidyl-tRNA synthetase
VRLEARTKNLKALLDRAAADGYTAFAAVSAGADVDALELRPLG